jgi:aconitate hydratase
MIANMTPENGATVTFFPVDDETLRYLRLTGRSDEQVALVEAYCKEQKLFRTADTPDPEYTDYLELDLGDVETSLAGPKLPHERVPLPELKTTFQSTLTAPKSENGFGLKAEELDLKTVVGTNGTTAEMGHGSVVIAAITSCTNTSNPSVMIGAGLVAKKAVEKGLEVQPYVKTSLAPGSTVVTEYLERAGLMEPLAELGFNLVGYGCTTCIGNSGPLAGEVVKGITSSNLVAASVLSGNRNFEGRINPYSLANYLASPPLVVAYALAGTVNLDLTQEPIGIGKTGEAVFLKDIWPTSGEINAAIESSVKPEMYKDRYAEVFTGNPTWNNIKGGEGDLYSWEPDSTYIQEPPFFLDLTTEIPPVSDIRGARVLVKLGDAITTDHISPAGAIPVESAAGKYLLDRGVKVRDFNSFGSRRGNDRVMTRGTFGNIRLKNQLVPGVEGSYTLYLPTGEQMSIFDAAMKYKNEDVPTIVLAGKLYGSGSSRDWAGKGPSLLGVRAVIAESYERIHRANLLGMGVLPLQYTNGKNADDLWLNGKEVFHFEGLKDDMPPNSEVTVRAVKEDGTEIRFMVITRLDTPIEVEYYRNGGILHTVLRDMLRE